MSWHSKSAVSMTFVCLGITKLECQISLGISFLSLICKEKSKAKRSKMHLNMIASMYSRRCGSYRMYLEGDSPYQAIMNVCELKWFSQISNCHNMNTLMQFCNVFHTQHAIFFAILDTWVGIMWFDHHKVLHVLMYAH